MRVCIQILLLSILAQIVTGQQSPNEFLESEPYYYRCGNRECFYQYKCCDAVTKYWCCALGDDAICCGHYCCSKGSTCGQGNCKYENMQLYLGAVNPENNENERVEQEQEQY